MTQGVLFTSLGYHFDANQRDSINSFFTDDICNYQLIESWTTRIIRYCDLT